MHTTDLGPWTHEHLLGQEHPSRGERRTLWVALLTAVFMFVEIWAGVVYGSMALLADGLHMGSHAVALGIAVAAYVYARRRAGDERFSFGTGKVNALGGFSGALLLAVFAVLMAWESIARFVNPVPIVFDQAIAVAVLGLVVNGVSVALLGIHGGAHDHHDHQHKHESHEHAAPSGAHHQSACGLLPCARRRVDVVYGDLRPARREAARSRLARSSDGCRRLAPGGPLVMGADKRLGRRPSRSASSTRRARPGPRRVRSRRGRTSRRPAHLVDRARDSRAAPGGASLRPSSSACRPPSPRARVWHLHVVGYRQA